jgi:DNA polymerase III alpha subunit
MISYRTAYMKKHHPVEFWTGLLTAYAGHDKEKKYVYTARREGTKVLPAHVNSSGASYTYDKEHHAIRKGLQTITNVGPVAAAELALKSPYTSLSDLGERVLPRKVSGAKSLALGKMPQDCGGAIFYLDQAGALTGLE